MTTGSAVPFTLAEHAARMARVTADGVRRLDTSPRELRVVGRPPTTAGSPVGGEVRTRRTRDGDGDRTPAPRRRR